MFNLSDLKCYKSATLWSTNRAIFNDFFYVFGNNLPSVSVDFRFHHPTFERHIWLISSSFSTIQLSVGAQVVGLQFLFGHEIQRSTIQKFADLWDTKCRWPAWLPYIYTTLCKCFSSGKCKVCILHTLSDYTYFQSTLISYDCISIWMKFKDLNSTSIR